MWKALLACAALALVATDARAAFEIRYSFDGQDGDQASTPVSANNSGVITADPIVRGPGLTAAKLDGSMNSTGWTNTTLIPDEQYYGFTLTATTGTFSLTSLVFGDKTSQDTGPTNFAIRTSVDGFANDLFTYDAALTGTRTFPPMSGPPLGPSFSDLRSIEIRIYGYGGSADGTYALTNRGNGDNVPGGLVVTGDVETSDVSAVPAPASALLLAAGAPVLLLARRRRSA